MTPHAAAMRPNAILSPWWTDLKVGLAMLTRLPSGRGLAGPQADPTRAVRVFPLVGALVGLVGGATYWSADGIGLPTMACGLLAVAATVLLTGAFHEDGLADVADGFGGAFERTRKLAIMRDSGIGVYGVIALVLSVVLRAAALAAICTPGAVAGALVAAHAVARAALPAVMASMAPARPDGLAAGLGRPQAGHAWIALVLGAAIAWATLGFAGAVLALATGGAAAAAVALIARAQIGGTTGDVLGAVEQAAEVAVLLSLAAAL